MNYITYFTDRNSGETIDQIETSANDGFEAMRKARSEYRGSPRYPLENMQVMTVSKYPKLLTEGLKESDES